MSRIIQVGSDNIEFPDNMSDSEIESVLKNQYQQKQHEISSPKNYIGDRPGIDNPDIRKWVNRAITAGEIGLPLLAGGLTAGGFTVGTGGTGAPLSPAVGIAAKAAVSPAITGAGEFVRSKFVEGEPTDKALIKGGTGAAIDLAGQGLFGLGKFGLQKTAIGKATQGMGEKATDFVTENLPKYVKPAKKYMGDIAESAGESINKTRDVLGSIVGFSKKEANELGDFIDTTQAKRDILGILKKYKVIPEKGGIEKSLERRNILNKVNGQIEKLKNISTPEKVFDVLDNIDDALVNTYDRRLAGKTLSDAEKAALQIRGELNNSAISGLKNSLSSDKKAYADYMRLLNDEGGEIKRALNSERGMQTLLNNAMKEGRQKTFDNLRELDKFLPEKERFFDKTVNKFVRTNLEKKNPVEIRNIMDVLLAKPLIQPAFERVPLMAARALPYTESPIMKFLSQAARTGTATGINSLMTSGGR